MLPVCYPDTVRQWSAFIFAASARTGIPAGWLAAMVWRESGGYPDVRSVGGDGYDIGLLQFGPDEVAYVQRAYHFGAYTYDPATNILTGAGYLEYLRQFDAGGNLYTATIEYNGGFLNPPAPTAVAYEEWVAAHDCL